MKDYKVIFTAFVLGLAILMIGIFTVSVFNYIAFLKEQNYSLLGIINYSISQLRRSIMSLEAQNNPREVIVLRLENLALKEKAEQLEKRVSQLLEQQSAIHLEGFVPREQEAVNNEIKQQPPTLEVVVKKESSGQQTVPGNRGYLIERKQTP